MRQEQTGSLKFLCYFWRFTLSVLVREGHILHLLLLFLTNLRFKLNFLVNERL